MFSHCSNVAHGGQDCRLPHPNIRPKAADVLQTTGGLIGGLKNHSILTSLMIRQADISCPLMTYSVWPQMFNLSL